VPDIAEKRTHRRLRIHLPVEYHLAGSSRLKISRTVTVNISTGGVYFETTADDIKPEDRLALELNLNQDDDRIPPHSRISTVAKVLRVTTIPEKNKDKPSFNRYGIAAKFEQPLKLTF